MMKVFALAVLVAAASASAARAGEVNPASGLVVRVDWQTPEQLPPRGVAPVVCSTPNGILRGPSYCLPRVGRLVLASSTGGVQC